MSRAALSTGLLSSIKRRTYSTTAAMESRARAVDAKTPPLAVNSSSAPTSSWVPDPVTGYYQPGDKRVEIDAAKDERDLACAAEGSRLKYLTCSCISFWPALPGRHQGIATQQAGEENYQGPQQATDQDIS